MARRRRIGGLTALGALFVVVVAAPAWAATKTVNLSADNTFSPAAITVSTGDTVKFAWQGGFHDVVFADGPSSGAPTGDAGTTWSRTFNAAGSFDYICTVHEALGMVGTVTVQASTGTTAATSSGAGATTSTTATTLPFTGPEDTILPILGIVMLLAGAGASIMALRRTS